MEHGLKVDIEIEGGGRNKKRVAGYDRMMEENKITTERENDRMYSNIQNT